MPPKANNSHKNPQRGVKTVPMDVDPVIPESIGNSGDKTDNPRRGKRTREVATGNVEEPPAAVKRPKRTPANKEVAPVNPEPNMRRNGRIQAVPAVVEKRKRRTREEITAAKAEADKNKQRLNELTEEADKRLDMQRVQMDVDEDNQRKEEAARTIRRFSDLENHASDSEGEEFVGFEEVSSSSDEACNNENAEDSLEEKTYEELEAEMAALREKLLVVKRKSGGDGKKCVYPCLMDNDRTTKTNTYTSELLPDWNKVTKKPAPKKRSQVEVAAGGLDDSDAAAINPFSSQDTSKAQKPQTKSSSKVVTLKRDLSRQNELVTEVVSDEEPFVPIRPSKPSTKAAPKVPATSGKVKTETKENGLQKVVVSTKRSNSNARITDLPDFAREGWRKLFLPTLYDRFFTSDEPFAKFIKGSQPFVAFVQTNIGLVYPQINYKVTTTDAIHLLAYNRINEKRSAIGSTALTVIESHLKTFSNDQSGRTNWLRWATRMDGPLFFRIPTPSSCPSNRKDPGYVNPQGRLMSTFIFRVATPFLLLKSGSVAKQSHPRGLFALVMAALERAVRAFLQPDMLKDFSNEFWGSKVVSYHSSLANIDENKWKEVLGACDTSLLSENEDHQADISLLDTNRAILFDFSSPLKP